MIFEEEDMHAWKDRLTDQQMVLIKLVARGMTNAEIGEQLQISPNTVKSALGWLYWRFGVDGRIPLVVAAFRAGVIS